MAENENKFIVIAHDLQTLAAMLRESNAVVFLWSNCIKKKLEEKLTATAATATEQYEWKGKVNITCSWCMESAFFTRPHTNAHRQAHANVGGARLLIWLRRNGVI